MKTVTHQHIEKTIDYINAQQEKDIDNFVQSFQNNQGFLFTYLISVDMDSLNDEEKEVQFFIGLAIWHAVHLANPNLEEVEEDELYQIEDLNQQMVNFLLEEDELSMANYTESILKSHPQKELLTFALEEVMDNEDVREKNIGVLFVNLKILIESLDLKS